MTLPTRILRAGHSPSTSRLRALLLGLDVLQVPYKAKLELQAVPSNPADPLAPGVFYCGKLVGYLLRYWALSLGGYACSTPFRPVRDDPCTLSKMASLASSPDTAQSALRLATPSKIDAE
jgi:hypothetical protein